MNANEIVSRLRRSAIESSFGQEHIAKQTLQAIAANCIEDLIGILRTIINNPRPSVDSKDSETEWTRRYNAYLDAVHKADLAVAEAEGSE